MSHQSLTILTPHGRRHAVKLTPNTTLLEVLEQVSRKFLLDPNRHVLKHHNKIVDLSRMFRFSGLPNNGLLEMEETDQVRTEAEVQIVLQAESGERLTGSFPPSHTLSDILLNLCPESGLERNSVVVFMRKEVFGTELKTTTLKNLGLTSGKAMLRLLHRNPEELRVQANVSAPLVTKINPAIIEEGPKALGRDDLKESVQKVEEPMQVDEEESSKQEVEQKAEKTEKDERMDSPEMKKIKFAGETGESSKSSETVTTEEMKRLEEEIKIVGPNDAVIFSLDATRRVQESDLPDSFFDLTIDDVRLLLRDLKDQAKNLDDAPLLTAKLREMENDKRILKLLQYKKTVIRIHFPDRHVLQVTFNPIDTIETVMNLVRKYLQNPQMDFHLFTTPPKEILPPSARLVELKCVPQAVIHFGADQDAKTGGKFVREDLLQELTSPDAAILLAMRSRGLSLANAGNRQYMNDQEMPNVSGNSTPKPRVPDNFHRSSASSSASVPKWFKISK